MSKQFTLYSHESGPNPWKVAIILAELGLEWDPIYLDLSAGEHKAKPYTDINPNGRVPTLVDHSNNDFKVWESGAIIQYLIEKYDTQHKVSFEKFEDKITAQQWLFFQTSGQGPYFGQGVFFLAYHPEKLPSAIERYQDQTKRVLMVIDNYLRDNNTPWLVNGKLSYADLSFYPWNKVIPFILGNEEWRKEYPYFTKWNDAMAELESVKSVYEMQGIVKEASAARKAAKKD